jgi:cytochrome c-type biogenesis protein CcmH
MTIWIIFAIMTAVVMAGLLMPVLRRTPTPAASRADFDKAVFRDQLAEVERDRERGIIGEAEAEAAKNEISRRLLQAAQAQPVSADTRKPGVVLPVLAALLVPAVALPLYIANGVPGMPDVPRAQRMENAAKSGDFEALVAQVEAHLGDNPDDISGWKVLAPAYEREQRWSDAADAYANILRLSKPDAATLASYGEMQVYAKQGLVTAEAHKAFGQALLIDPKDPKSRYYVALGLKQEGKSAEAKAAFAALLADSPADAPWRGIVQAELNDQTSRPPALTAEQMASGAGMAAGDQQQMIRSMVDGLEAKLKADANNLDGWLRLIRARTVLDEADRARQALATAREYFKDQPAALTSLDGLAKELNLI